MATLLLIIIYIAFIGLGIPDSLFGAAWPAIYHEFNLPLSAANYVTLLISGGTIVSSLISAWVINHFGTGKVTAFSTGLTATALLGFSMSNSIWWLCLFAIPLGLGAGAIDTALNNYVALHYQASQMSFLHCFYGIGVSLSPYLMAHALAQNNAWRNGYRMAFYLQLGITILLIVTLPLWQKVHAKHEYTAGKSTTLSFKSIIKVPGVQWVWIIFLGTCAIEFTCGIWGATFLVNTREMVASSAAQIVTLYYLGIMIGRLVSGIVASRVTSWHIIFGGQLILLLGIGMLLLPLSVVLAGTGLFLIGFGNSTVFPNLIFLTPQNFGVDISQSIMGTQMAASYVGTMLMPALFGLLAQKLGSGTLPYFILIMYFVMITATVALVRNLQKRGKYNS